MAVKYDTYGCSIQRHTYKVYDHECIISEDLTDENCTLHQCHSYDGGKVCSLHYTFCDYKVQTCMEYVAFTNTHITIENITKFKAQLSLKHNQGMIINGLLI